jgi:hypothetical protein
MGALCTERAMALYEEARAGEAAALRTEFVAEDGGAHLNEREVTHLAPEGQEVRCHPLLACSRGFSDP